MKKSVTISVSILFHLIFWGWNITFLGYVGLLLLPLVFPHLITALLDGLLPLDFAFTLVALLLVPLACSGIGLRHLRRQPGKLMQLLYGVEAPLFILCLVRLFLLREVPPGGMQVLISVSLCVVAFLMTLLHGYADRQPRFAWAQLFSHSLMVLVGLYVGGVTLLYALPLLVYVGRGVLSFSWFPSLSYFLTPGVFFGLLLLFLSASLVMFLPPVMTLFYLRSGRQILRAFAAQYGQKRAIAGAFGVITATLVLFVGLQQQPQHQAFALLQNPPQSAKERQELIAKADVIRQGLLNAYLSSYRYVSTTQTNDHVQRMYAALGAPAWLAEGLQSFHNTLMAPFLYQGEPMDVGRATQLYADFFDTPIQKGEQAAINRALQSTYNRDSANAGLLNLNQRQVWLRSQSIQVQEQGSWAKVELHEVYANQTPYNQEILYYFTLPESAVVTGLWLGDTANLNQRFPYVVAPRGAAQKVYNEQVRRQADPALLEQVGPRHYRLRAFPIPPKMLLTDTGSRNSAATEMHLWLTYKVLRQEQGWALPVLGEKRNIYWSNATQRYRDGHNTRVGDVWLEAYLPARSPAAPIPPVTHLQDDTLMTAQPLTAQDQALPRNQRFAVILDTSYSMGRHRQAVQQTFDWLKEQGFANDRLEDNDADLYVGAIAGMLPQRLDNVGEFDLQHFGFYGTIQPKELLRQFDQLRGNTRYDGILLVTDEGSYELADDQKTLPAMVAPLWFIHLGAFPPAYDDATLQAMQISRGGVASQISEALHRIAAEAALGPTGVSAVDGYLWRMTPASDGPPQPQTQKAKPSGFEAIAARQRILGLGRQQDLNRLENLDAIHAIAQRYSLVTPYSSMLVLINDEQRQALKAAEAQKDRFERTVESGEETLTQPFDPMASVPEPTTVVGVMLAASGVIIGRRRSRRKIRF